ncbi:MAG: hypothetical protein KDC90_19515, partial [Ignavibacteriae bacterium]|nr:hypothetical protein [Ignavibacteriota bacterium]
KEKVEPVNLIFVDNSKSVKEISSTDEISKINSVVNSIYTDVENTRILTFADKVNEHKIDDSIYFSGKSTQFDNIFKELKSFQNVASAIIISDGINNQGEDPTQEASNLGFPIFTIGLGDTTSEADVKVEKITSNEFIYAGRETEIEVVISNNNLTNKKVNVQLSENQKLIVQKEIVLSSTEINRVRFPYSSEIEGEHKLLVNLISNENEKNKSNNSKIALVNVLATKKKITIIAGSPSADLSIVKSSLNKNEDYEVTSIVQLNSSSYANNRNDFKFVEEADILFLIGFPNENTSPEYIKKVANEISESKKATFFIFSLNLDFTKLGNLKNILPFNVSQISNTFKEIQVKAKDLKYSLLGSGNENLNEWEKLPPINLTRSKYIPSIESQVLLEDNIAKQPILFSKAQKGSKIMVLTAANFWKWKLQTANKHSQLFDNLLINSVKWLGLNNDDQKFALTTQKKTFRLGEKIIFSASYYDDTYEPINNASIEVNI